MIKSMFISALMAMAFVSNVLTPSPASAQSIGGGIGVTVLGSGSLGSISGGGISNGTVVGSQTMKAFSDGLGGTKLTLGRTGASIVSEHSLSGSATQLTTGGALGVGGSAFSGTSFGTGSFLGLNGFLGSSF